MPKARLHMGRVTGGRSFGRNARSLSIDIELQTGWCIYVDKRILRIRRPSGSKAALRPAVPE